MTGHGRARTTLHAFAAFVLITAATECNGPGDVDDATTEDEVLDDVASDDAPSDDETSDDAPSDDDVDDGPVVVAAPFRIPAISEEGIAGDVVAQRILDACVEAQLAAGVEPPQPCVEIRNEERPDPDRDPGQFIATDPPEDTEIRPSETVTVIVADASSPVETDDALVDTLDGDSGEETDLDDDAS